MCLERNNVGNAADLVIKVIPVHDPELLRGGGITGKGLNVPVNPVKNTTHQVDLQAIIHPVGLLLQNVELDVVAIRIVGLQLQSAVLNELIIHVADPQQLDVTLSGVGTHVAVLSAQNAAQRNLVDLQNIVLEEVVSLQLQNTV